MVICGDFNNSKIPWEAPDSSRGANEQAFVHVDALNNHLQAAIHYKKAQAYLHKLHV